MPPHSRRETLALLGGCAVLATGCAPVAVRDRLKVFDTVIKTIQDHYFDPLALNDDWDRAVREARRHASKVENPASFYLDVLQPMLERLDASHVVLSPPGNRITLPKGRGFRIPAPRRGQRPFFLLRSDEGGMGASLAWNGETWVVAEVRPGGIASDAGLKAGDLVRLGGYRRTVQGGELSLIDHRNNQEAKLVWTRMTAATQSLRDLGGGAIHLRFDRFDRPTIDWALSQLRRDPASVMLDLTDNTGGELKEFHRLVSALLPAGRNLGQVITSSGPVPIRSGGEVRPYTGKVVTLIGVRSTSAAEITAACLRYHGRSRLIGQPTAGAVLVSLRYALPDGGHLQLPYADYKDPSGRRIEGVGVSPDIAVPMAEDITSPRAAARYLAA